MCVCVYVEHMPMGQNQALLKISSGCQVVAVTCIALCT